MSRAAGQAGRWAFAAVLLSAAAFAEQPLPIYPGTIHTRIGNDLVIAGEYYRMAYFLTGDSMKKVAGFFEKQWKSDGYPVTVDGDFEDEGIVSAFYTREGLMRSVVLKKHGGKTMGITVLKDLWTKDPLARANKLPQIEGVFFSQDLVARDDAGGTQVRAQLLEQPLKTARDQVAKAFTDKGWLLARESGAKEQSGTQRVIEFTRGKEQTVATLVQVDEQMTALNLTWVGSDRPDAVPNDTALEESKRRFEAGKKK